MDFMKKKLVCTLEDKQSNSINYLIDTIVHTMGLSVYIIEINAFISGREFRKSVVVFMQSVKGDKCFATLNSAQTI